MRENLQFFIYLDDDIIQPLLGYISYMNNGKIKFFFSSRKKRIVSQVNTHVSRIWKKQQTFQLRKSPLVILAFLALMQQDHHPLHHPPAVQTVKRMCIWSRNVFTSIKIILHITFPARSSVLSWFNASASASNTATGHIKNTNLLESLNAKKILQNRHETPQFSWSWIKRFWKFQMITRASNMNKDTRQ